MREGLRVLSGLLRGVNPLAESRCAGCGRAATLEGALCADCAGLAALQTGETAASSEACPGCAMPAGQGGGLCAACREKPRPWSLCVACAPYHGPLRDMLLAYKFEARLDLGRALMEAVLAGFEEGVSRHAELSGCEGVAPVPLHPRRLVSRGFNQSLEMARLLARRRGLPLWPGALARVRRTAPQMTLAREARAENIRGAFAADACLVSGRRVLLVDDIMTTGATLEECAKALLAAGAARVDVLVLARA